MELADTKAQLQRMLLMFTSCHGSVAVPTMFHCCCVCVAALTLIAGSPLKIDLRPVLPDAVPILASFLRKNQRALKLCTLAALDILLRNYR